MKTIAVLLFFSRPTEILQVFIRSLSRIWQRDDTWHFAANKYEAYNWQEVENYAYRGGKSSYASERDEVFANSCDNCGNVADGSRQR